MKLSKAIRIHPDDHVAVAVGPLSPEHVVQIGDLSLTVRDAIPAGHKIAMVPIARGEVVIKYGAPIGAATQPIAPGMHVHVHNLRTRLTTETCYAREPIHAQALSRLAPATFEGFVRPDGNVGTRNEIWIIPTVGCVNRVARALARRASEQPATATIDGIHAFEHPYGCSQLGADLHNTQKLLAALARHPNAGGVLVVGLGCENNHILAFQEFLGESDPDRIAFLATQQVDDELAAGAHLLERLIEHAAGFRRQPIAVSDLKVGLKCGASDGFSGMTANPLIGAAADRIVAMGGTTFLSEVPEMFGAEAVLSARCADRAVFDKFVRMIEDFKAAYTRHSQPVYENPSPGNRDGGITTLEEKSLGCIQKAGTSPIVDVLGYAEPACRLGLSLVSAPGNDMVSTTALAAAGAQVILFSTGRGTPLGGPVPTVKISTTRALADKKPRWIDFDASPLLEGVPMPKLAGNLVKRLLQIASGGAYTQNERNGFRDIAIFKEGVTL